MNNESFSKCSCQLCGNHLEFPIEAAGMTIDCPHCNEQTTLTLPESETPPPARMSATEIISAFHGTIPKTRASFFYQLGFIFVSFTMILLPLIYIALVGLAAWGVYLYATHFSSLLSFGHTGYYRSYRVYLFKIMLYVTPLFVGVILLLFMIKPLFARRPRHAQPLALNPAVEPTVYAFVARICDLVGAPMPSRIDLDCNLNASASFRRGFKSLFGKDLVLTIGLPLIAGMSMQQLAGVVAHEFGHFTQGFGMRLDYIVRRINFWFARVVYERDEWDVWLEEMAADAEDWRWMIVVNCAQLGVWFSRLILKLLMFTGHGISAFLSRQMEYDADSYQMKLVGSQAFEESFRRLHVLDALLKPSYNEVRIGWNNNKVLPDNFPAVLMKHDRLLVPEKRTKVEDTMALHPTSVFDTHPSTGDRIRCARQRQFPGIFHLNAPATDLFNNFEVLSKQVTQLHYADDLGLPLMAAKLVPVLQEQPVSDPPADPLGSSEKVTERKFRLKTNAS